MLKRSLGTLLFITTYLDFKLLIKIYKRDRITKDFICSWSFGSFKEIK